MILRPAIGLLLIVMIGGCASPSRREWRSQPEMDEVVTDHLTARLTPIRFDARFFQAFLLEVTNHTNTPMSIDWNASRYLYNGRPSSGFVFEGIDPKTIRDSIIPADTIPPLKTLSKEITPLNLIAVAPLRDNTVPAGKSGITAGMIPAGESGILLVVRQEGKTIEERLTVRITTTEGRQ